MKGFVLNLENVKCLILIVILILVIYCCIKKTETFKDFAPLELAPGNERNANQFAIDGNIPLPYTKDLIAKHDYEGITAQDDGCGSDCAKFCNEEQERNYSDMKFDVRESSNGAPAGCIKYNDGKILYVKTCKDHVNCRTENCNGCKVLWTPKTYKRKKQQFQSEDNRLSVGLSMDVQR
jgi:hypothetical protein